ncbi:MAG: hypothetical protein FWG81_01790 [Betaproteobacteria bacterium]|nr:hypothetical protein [Betaproteobacteria bacterium]
MNALVLDLDDSVRGLPDIMRLKMGDWQEAVRFGCSWRIWHEFRARLETLLPAAHGPVLMGSGDFHHISCLLIERQRQHDGLHVLVCDNHPDNMRFPFGIHCGSWVAHAACLPHVARIDVVGVSSSDVGWRHAWENRLGPLYRGRVRYWTIGVKSGWTRALGADVARNFADAESLVSALARELSGTSAPLYLSIDKDALHESVARTNWDQGLLLLDDLLSIVNTARPRLVGCDITGEVSAYRYQTRWKRFLSALDNQPAISPDDLAAWQQQQLAVNQALLQAIG